MTRDETVSMLMLLKAAYPHFYNKQSEEEVITTIDLWAEMFADDDINIVKYALKELIFAHTGFPPDIAAVKTRIKEFVSAASGELTDEELWQKLRRATSNGYYGAKEEFEKLPKVVQRYLGDPSALRELSQMDEETFNTVVHGQFLKQIQALKSREEYDRRLPPEVKKLAGTFAGYIGDKPEEEEDD